jgi:MFS family permease
MNQRRSMPVELLSFRRGRVSFLASLATTGMSAAAMGIISMAVPWFLISGGSGATWAGVASFAIQIPGVLGLAAGGYFADVFGPRRVLVYSNTASLLGGGLAAVVSIVSPEALTSVICFLAMANLVGAPGNVAQHSRIPELGLFAGLPIARANGLRDAAAMAGMISGPASAVMLISIFGLPAALLAACSILFAIALIDAALFPKFQPARRQADRSAPSAASIIRADRFLTSIIAIGLVLVAAFASLDEIVAPTLAIAGGLPPSRLALFLALAGIANICGAIVFIWIGHRIAHRRIFVGGIAIAAFGFGALAALAPVWSFVLAPLLIGLGVGPLSPIVMTAIQRRVDFEARGSVIGLFQSAVMAAQPISAILVGPIVDIVGVWTMTAALAVGVLFVALSAALMPTLRSLDAGLTLPSGAAPEAPKDSGPSVTHPSQKEHSQ